MRLLLDSQAVLMTMSPAAALSNRVRAALLDPANTVFVSAATPYELEWKKAIGKLSFPDVADWSRAMSAAGYQELTIALAHSERAARLPKHHRDPWDRILIAQALVENLTLVSGDRRIAAYGAPMLW
ncbi:MAG: type II toxin-antitoxin system VapC family toxin [Pseudomonadota bacterium]